ncbi:MAG: hypothetical protein U0167_15580 [bacterium]
MRAHPLVPIALSLLAVGALASCDPKKLDGTPTDTGGTTNNPPQTVTPEAIAIGNMLALHTEVLRAGLSVAAQFDTASAAPAPRGILQSGCFTLSESDSTTPVWGMRLDGCTDAHGTTYRGGGEFAPVDTVDGFAFFPWGEPDIIRASNDTDSDYAHEVSSGTLDFTFTRSAGHVNGVTIDKNLRHTVQNETVTISYDSVHYTGALGSLPDYPDAGSVVGVGWNGVGIFDVTFGAGGHATYTMQGTNFAVDLATGNVTIATN